MKLVITGTPGVGKTVLAKKLARELGARLVDANSLVKKKGLWENAREHTVDLRALQRELKKVRGNAVVEGHLLCEFQLPSVDRVVVLRCNPLALAKRLRARSYPPRKVSDNVLAEALDYCLVKSEENYGKRKVIQLNATRWLSPQLVLRKIRARESDRVNWTRVLLGILKGGKGGKSAAALGKGLKKSAL